MLRDLRGKLILTCLLDSYVLNLVADTYRRATDGLPVLILNLPVSCQYSELGVKFSR